MKKTVSIEFEEQAKCVVTNVKIEYEFTQPDLLKTNEYILQETQELMEKAWAYANAKSIQKMNPQYNKSF